MIKGPGTWGSRGPPAQPLGAQVEGDGANFCPSGSPAPRGPGLTDEQLTPPLRSGHRWGWRVGGHSGENEDPTVTDQQGLRGHLQGAACSWGPTRASCPQPAPSWGPRQGQRGSAVLRSPSRLAPSQQMRVTP